MNKLWAVWITAMEYGIAPEDLFFHIGETYSPYTEVSLKRLEADCGDLEREIAVNPFFRWNSIFAPLLDSNDGLYDELTLVLADLVLHHIAEIDACSGMSKEELYIQFIVRDMEHGIFGGKESAALFDNREKKKIANQLLCQYRTGCSVECLLKSLSAVFPAAKVHMGEDGVVFIFMNQSEEHRARRKLDFILNIFLNLDYHCQLYWEYFPGVIGIEETMKLENFVLI